MADLRVVTAAATAPRVRRARTAAQQQSAHLEGLGLAVAALVVLFAGWLAYRQHAPALDAMTAEIAAGRAVDINQAADARALAPLLERFATDADRQTAASAILETRRTLGPFTHVGALTRVRQTGADAAPLFTPASITAIKSAAVVRSADAYRSLALRAALLFFGVFLVAHAVRRFGGAAGDPVLIPAVMLLTGLSAAAMMSMRDPLRDTDAAGALVMGVAMGCAALVALSFVDFEDPRLKRATVLPAAIAVILAAALLLLGSGPGTSGAKVNLLGMQPIEVIRLLAVLALASYFSRRWQMLREIAAPAGPSPAVRRRVTLPRLRDVRPLAVIVGTLLVFFVLQKDLGPALVLGAIALGLYGVARGRAGLVVAGFAVLAAGFAAGYWFGVPSTVARRVAIWLDPWHNGLVGGDQIAHAQWALASGGAWGLGGGFGEGQLIPAGHTDLIVAVIGEEIGFVGLLAVAALFSIVIWRVLHIAERAPGDYTAFLALGCALALAIPAFVIVGGLLGLVPLSGVATPFLSYGKSAMICNFAAVGIALAIANRGGARRRAFTPQLRTLRIVLAACAIVLAGRALWIQTLRADSITLRPSLVRQADGGARYQYNPRLLQAARMIPRGTIFDRNGLPIAANDAASVAPTLKRLEAAGAGVAPCPAPAERCYPLGDAAFHVLGNATTQTNWAARNTSFAERDAAPVLQGFDDRSRIVDVRLANGTTTAVLAHDYSDLLPLVRSRGFLEHPDVQRLLSRNRDVHLTIDAPLQLLVARALESRARAAGSGRAAAVVIDVGTGSILASASYPWPELRAMESFDQAPSPEQLLDRARYGLYPPGSTFKLITAGAALSSSRPDRLPSFQCERLPDGRVGANVRGVGRPIRDDALDKEPHGHVDLRRGLVVSCNAYFAQLAMHLGPAPIADLASAAGIQAATDPVGENLRRTLPFAGYGQGEVLASPLRMARAVAAIAGGGSILETPIVRREGGPASTPWVSPGNAAMLRSAMREVVTSGTGRALSSHAIAIGGKTGTAEVAGAASHSWFVGFAPAGGDGARIAFAVVVENAGYGGRAAASVAGDIVTAARKAGVIR